MPTPRMKSRELLDMALIAYYWGEKKYATSIIREICRKEGLEENTVDGKKAKPTHPKGAGSSKGKGV